MTTTPTGKTKALPIILGIIALVVVIGLLNKEDDEPANTSSAIPTSMEVFDPQQDPAPLTEQPAAPEANTGVASEAVVPNVVGLNHQLAQDTLQASGFYVLFEEDATGRGRQLLMDRNWEVVSQSVPGGTTTSIVTPIKLFSKKIGE